MGEELVAVIIPAFNASDTIGSTLRSACNQTYKNLEIIVVDDGSTDATPSLVAKHAKDDSRVRLIRQPNGGVAAARNRGVEEANGPYIAPLDADDLWHPMKIEQQVRAMSSRESVGLVYTWSVIVTSHDSIRRRKPGPLFEGKVLESMCKRNFIGNGSSPLMRRHLVQTVGGYDETLRARSAQGCEDWKLYIQMAERSEFAVIPDYLTGYRQNDRNMSSDSGQMLRSSDLVRAEFAAKYPEYETLFYNGRTDFLVGLITRAVDDKRWSDEWRLVVELARHDAPRLLRFAARGVAKHLNSVLRVKNAPSEPFLCNPIDMRDGASGQPGR